VLGCGRERPEVGAQREQQLGGGAGGAPASSGERDRRGRGEELQRAESKWVWGLLGVGAGSSGGSALRGERRPWRRDERHDGGTEQHAARVGGRRARRSGTRRVQLAAAAGNGVAQAHAARGVHR